MKTPTHPAIARDRQRGLSLVELMVALTIGLLLTLGLFTMISRSSSAFQTQDDFARMQDNATAALRYIGDSVRHAGFYGYTRDTATIDITLGAVATGAGCGSAANPPAANWALNAGQPIFGLSGLTAGTVAASLPCIQAANFVDGPVLITRHAIGIRVPDAVGPDGDLANDIVNLPDFGTTIYIQSDANSGLVFYGANFAALKAAANTRRLPVTLADADIFQYQTHVYYLRPCSRPTGGGGACLGSDDGGRPIPTLVRQELNGSAMIEVPLVEGIERIDFRYGIDNEPAGAPDGVPERFSATPAAGDWANVTTVRVTILVRSPSVSIDMHQDEGKTYDLDGDGVADFTCAPGVNCNYKRKVFSQTFQLRNIAQRRGA